VNLKIELWGREVDQSIIARSHGRDIGKTAIFAIQQIFEKMQRIQVLAQELDFSILF
jgi:hypothetical protein